MLNSITRTRGLVCQIIRNGRCHHFGKYNPVILECAPRKDSAIARATLSTASNMQSKTCDSCNISWWQVIIVTTLGSEKKDQFEGRPLYLDAQATTAMVQYILMTSSYGKFCWFWLSHLLFRILEFWMPCYHTSPIIMGILILGLMPMVGKVKKL